MTGAASLGSISGQQPRRLLVGKVLEQVGGVVGAHLLQHVGGSLRGERAQDAHLVAQRQLLEHVGEADVVEGRGDFDLALVGQRVQGAGQVGRPHRLEGGDEAGRPLVLLEGVEARHLSPVDDPRVPPPLS
ncbi:hypothetical protein GCM10020219_004850 [Nonomuraea dietziae]